MQDTSGRGCPETLTTGPTCTATSQVLEQAFARLSGCWGPRGAVGEAAGCLCNGTWVLLQRARRAHVGAAGLHVVLGATAVVGSGRDMSRQRQGCRYGEETTLHCLPDRGKLSSMLTSMHITTGQLSGQGTSSLNTSLSPWAELWPSGKNEDGDLLKATNNLQMLQVIMVFNQLPRAEQVQLLSEGCMALGLPQGTHLPDAVLLNLHLPKPLSTTCFQGACWEQSPNHLILTPSLRIVGEGASQ